MMMKLRHLFGNPELAGMLMRHWPQDETPPATFERFRISANAVYPFKINGQEHFLRFSPISEKTTTHIRAELGYIHLLRQAGFAANQPVPAKSGAELIEAETPWGGYHACVFKAVSGRPVSQCGASDEIVSACGGALAQMHKIASGFGSATPERPTHNHIFTWMQDILLGLPAETIALQELELLQQALRALPATAQNYGLIHFDFEPDNVFYDTENRPACSVIDFDDSMQHWYVMDIAQALNGLKEEFGPEGFAIRRGFFLEGYRRVFDIDRDIYGHLPVFNRFARLLKYTRVRRAVQERWQNEPAWMLALRAKLEARLAEYAQEFGRATSPNP